MTESRATRRPGAGPVLWAVLLLFCVLLGALTYRFSLGQDPSGAGASEAPAPARKVIVRRVVTTVVPATPGPATAEPGAAPPVTEAAAPASEAVPVSEPVTSSS